MKNLFWLLLVPFLFACTDYDYRFADADDYRYLAPVPQYRHYHRHHRPHTRYYNEDQATVFVPATPRSGTRHGHPGSAAARIIEAPGFVNLHKHP